LFEPENEQMSLKKFANAMVTFM